MRRCSKHMNAGVAAVRAPDMKTNCGLNLSQHFKEKEMTIHRGMLSALLAAALATISIPLVAQAADEKAGTPTRSSEQIKAVRNGYVVANGLKYHYRIYGKGEPLVLLHGGLAHSQMFGPVLAALAKHRQVIGLDLHGHGRTALGDRPIRFKDMGDDVATVASSLGYKKVDVLGYSLGGGVALRLAAQHPQLVRRLVIVSAPYAQNGWHSEMLPLHASVNATMAEEMKGSPLHLAYTAVAPRPQDFPRLLDQLGNLMRESYDWSEDVKKLRMPTMLVYGDADMVRPDHMVQFYKLLGGGLRDAGWQREHMSINRFAVIPNMTHYEFMSSTTLATAVLPFLQTKNGGTAR
jgi:pimeloyl-ACP methyl ester carboxylesterase